MSTRKGEKGDGLCSRLAGGLRASGESKSLSQNQKTPGQRSLTDVRQRLGRDGAGEIRDAATRGATTDRAGRNFPSGVFFVPGWQGGPVCELPEPFGAREGLERRAARPWLNRARQHM